MGPPAVSAAGDLSPLLSGDPPRASTSRSPGSRRQRRRVALGRDVDATVLSLGVFAGARARG
eukprot:9062290-Lingulodinium_polyedra.AAC.1